MKEELDAIAQHQVFGDFMVLTEGRKALPSHWVYKFKRDGAGNVQRFKGLGTLWRKSPNRRHRPPSYVCTDCSLGPRQAGTHDRRHVQSRDPSSGRMHGFCGSGIGSKNLYAATAGIPSFAPEWEPIQRSRIIKCFLEDCTPLEKVSLLPETVFARLVSHF